MVEGRETRLTADGRYRPARVAVRTRRPDWPHGTGFGGCGLFLSARPYPDDKAHVAHIVYKAGMECAGNQDGPWCIERTGKTTQPIEIARLLGLTRFVTRQVH